MNVKFINPFLTSTMSAFKTMLNCSLTRGTPFAKQHHRPENEVSGIIGLSGKAQGTVVLGLNREAALSCTEAMLMERPEEIDSDVIDAVGELANIIAGGAKAQLEELELSISLPTVITGTSYCVEFPRKVIPICIPFDSIWGPISVEVGLTERPD